MKNTNWTSIHVESPQILKKDVEPGQYRIQMERYKTHVAITCHLLNAMIHVIYCSENNSEQIYSNIRDDLKNFITQPRTKSETDAFCKKFIEKYKQYDEIG